MDNALTCKSAKCAPTLIEVKSSITALAIVHGSGAICL